MEVLRSIRVDIEIDSNKSTDKISFDNFFDAAQLILSKLSDEQRMELFGYYCKACGSDNPKCQCWNDE